MTVPAPRHPTLTTDWLTGLVLGGLVLLTSLSFVLGVIAPPLLIVSVALILWNGSRAVAGAGFLTGAGLLWTVLFARLALTCGAGAVFVDPTCFSDDLSTPLLAAASVLAVALAASAAAFRRTAR